MGITRFMNLIQHQTIQFKSSDEIDSFMMRFKHTFGHFDSFAKCEEKRFIFIIFMCGRTQDAMSSKSKQATDGTLGRMLVTGCPSLRSGQNPRGCLLCLISWFDGRKLGFKSTSSTIWDSKQLSSTAGVKTSYVERSETNAKHFCWSLLNIC
jgi:hypothetical protein